MPESSQKDHMPMNARRAFGEHSATCSEVQNSGFMDRIRAKKRLPSHFIPESKRARLAWESKPRPLHPSVVRWRSRSANTLQYVQRIPTCDYFLNPVDSVNNTEGMNRTR